MPVSVTCPKCDARLKAPDGSAGRTLRCPRCAGPVAVPTTTGPAVHFAFEPAGQTPAAADNPFEDDRPPDDAGSDDSADSRKRPRSTTKRKPAPGFNPFDEVPGEESSAAPPKKRRYRKDGDYNPFGDVPQDEVPDPVGEGFEFGIETPPPAPAGEFEFGPPDPRGDDDPRRRRR